MKNTRRLFNKTALAAAMAVAIGGIVSIDQSVDLSSGMSLFVSTAYAQDDGGQGGGKHGAMGQKGGGQGDRGAGGQGYRGGKSMRDVLSDSDEGEEDSDRPEWAGTPGRDGKPGGGNAGGDRKKGGDYGDLFVVLRDADGNPVMAGDEYYILLSDGTVVKTVDGEVPSAYLDLAVPVEFGRMNIARSPASVLEHALTEALSKLVTLPTNEDGLVVIDASNLAAVTDASGRFVIGDASIDSPLENLAIYEALLTAKEVTVDDRTLLELSVTASKDGADSVYTIYVDPAVRLDLAASAIAASSDKTGELTADEIVLISSFLGVDDELASLMESYTYDKAAAFDGEIVSVLVDPEGDGTYFTATGDVLSLIDQYAGDIWNTVSQPEVMAYTDEQSVQYEDALSGIYLFTQAADDAVQVLEFVHDYEPPE